MWAKGTQGSSKEATCTNNTHLCEVFVEVKLGRHGATNVETIILQLDPHRRGAPPATAPRARVRVGVEL